MVVACAYYVISTETIFQRATIEIDNVLDKAGALPLSKPLYDCMVCMSSVWGGTSFYLLSRLFAPEFGALETICAIPVIGGMMVLISCYYFMVEISKNDMEGDTTRGGV